MNISSPDAVQREIKNRFHFVDRDPNGRQRLFFDNAGGSLRLKCWSRRRPESPERMHAVVLHLHDVQLCWTDDVRTVLKVRAGSVHASPPAACPPSCGQIAENVPGTNMVTTMLQHTSAYDAMSQYAERTGRELRLAPSNPVTAAPTSTTCEPCRREHLPPQRDLRVEQTPARRSTSPLHCDSPADIDRFLHITQQIASAQRVAADTT